MASSYSVCINDLPDDLLVKIFTLLAASIEDIHSSRRVSRRFYRLSYNFNVLSQVSLDISRHRWNQFAWNSELEWAHFPFDVLASVRNYDNFVHMCFENGNPQALMAIFEMGARQYFEAGLSEMYQQGRGLRNIAFATNRGLREAAELYGAILICLGGEQRKTGFDILRPYIISLTPTEVLKIEERWSTHERRLWFTLRAGFVMYHLKVTYVKEGCQCGGLTTAWFQSPWMGVDRFDQFAGMPAVEACEACLWHEFIKRLFNFDSLLL